jgi:hypothetical protein
MIGFDPECGLLEADERSLIEPLRQAVALAPRGRLADLHRADQNRPRKCRRAPLHRRTRRCRHGPFTSWRTLTVSRPSPLGDDRNRCHFRVERSPLSRPIVSHAVSPVMRPPSQPLGQSTSGCKAPSTVSMSRALEGFVDSFEKSGLGQGAPKTVMRAYRPIPPSRRERQAPRRARAPAFGQPYYYGVARGVPPACNVTIERPGRLRLAPVV